MNNVSCDHGLWLVALRKYKRHIEYAHHCISYVPYNVYFIVLNIYHMNYASRATFIVFFFLGRQSWSTTAIVAPTAVPDDMK